MKKIVTVVGARPQFVKAAVVSRALQAHAGLEERLVHTGQHYDAAMSDVFFEELGLDPPAYHLGVGSGTHGKQTGRMLHELEVVLLQERPDVTLVYGDTNSTVAGALAAAKLHIPTAHVEAGLRSFNRRMPEEINRVLSDQLSSLLFAATPEAENNLRKEGFPPERIRQVGDVMYDAALVFAERAERRSGILAAHGLRPREYVLATIHRAENTDDAARLRTIFEGLCRIAAEFRLVLPLHPRTRAALVREGLFELVAGRLHLIDPVGYFDMIQLERHAAVVATDSGGVQKEAFFYGVPCITLRDETEWTETVAAGANRLVGADAGRLIEAVTAALHNSNRLPDAGPYYGNGQASTRIATMLANEELTL